MFDFIMSNLPAIGTAAASIISAGAIIAKLTPNETDNEVLYYILKVADIVGLNTKPTEYVEFK